MVFLHILYIQNRQQTGTERSFVLRAHVEPSPLGTLAAADLAAEDKLAPAVVLRVLLYARVAPPTAGAEVLTGVGSRGVRVALSTHRPQRAHRGVPDAVVGRVLHEYQLVVAARGQDEGAPLPHHVVPPGPAGEIGGVQASYAVGQHAELGKLVLTGEHRAGSRDSNTATDVGRLVHSLHHLQSKEAG